MGYSVPQDPAFPRPSRLESREHRQWLSVSLLHRAELMAVEEAASHPGSHMPLRRAAVPIWKGPVQLLEESGPRDPSSKKEAQGVASGE